MDWEKARFKRQKENIDKNLRWGSTTFNLLGVKFSTELAAIPNLNYSVIVDEIPKRLNF